MHYSKIKHFDTANGPGIRTSLFVSGCENHCKGCFNPETWNKENGDLFTEEILEELLNSIDQPYCSGLSLLGGDPLAPYNLDEVKHIVETFRKRFGFSKNIWMWTGYLFEDIIQNKDKWEIVKQVDCLVDGPFILKERDLTLKYKGSSNQRVIDVQDSQKFDCLCTIQERKRIIDFNEKI